jgi:hypothetical protein
MGLGQELLHGPPAGRGGPADPLGEHAVLRRDRADRLQRLALRRQQPVGQPGRSDLPAARRPRRKRGARPRTTPGRADPEARTGQGTGGSQRSGPGGRGQASGRRRKGDHHAEKHREGPRPRTGGFREVVGTAGCEGRIRTGRIAGRTVAGHAHRSRGAAPGAAELVGQGRARRGRGRAVPGSRLRLGRPGNVAVADRGRRRRIPCLRRHRHHALAARPLGHPCAA